MQKDIFIIKYSSRFLIKSISGLPPDFETDTCLDWPMVKAVYFLAKTFPNHTLIWQPFQSTTKFDVVEIVQKQHQATFSFWYGKGYQSSIQKLGYVFFDSPFFKRPKNEERFATWLACPGTGAIHASLLQHFVELQTIKSFPQWVLQLGFSGSKKGLIPYYEPRLALEDTTSHQISSVELFTFVARNMKKRWLVHFLMLWLRFEKGIPLLAFIKSLGLAKISITCPSYILEGEKQLEGNATIDVIIPTLQRKSYLEKVLIDLSKQSQVPCKVIIVEQNGDNQSASELEELAKRDYPFEIIHRFTHQMGACNARNLALSLATSDWLFFADDDIELEPRALESALKTAERYDVKGVSLGVYCKGENMQPKPDIAVAHIFGTCAALAKNSFGQVLFDRSLEFGYGEDLDYGVQLRAINGHIISVQEFPILHHKAPSGGFRLEIKHPWSEELVRPKPTPQMQYYFMKNTSPEQYKGYRFYYLLPRTIRGLMHYAWRKKQWNLSVKWAQKLG